MGMMQQHCNDACCDIDRELITLIQQGLPLVQRPYQAIAGQLGIDEQQVIDRIASLRRQGDIKRFGIVVRHHELGYRSNGMVVWNVPDDRVRELGRCIGKYACVTLSYRRPRHLPDWPYNLFTMVHGKSREQVIEHVDQIIRSCKLEDIDHSILFSTRRFKQRGARYCHQNNHDKETR